MNADLNDVVYQIKLRGKLDVRWSDWVGGMSISYEMCSDDLPITTLTGTVIDQSALYGILWKLRDLNLKLISVTLIETNSKGKGLAQYEGRNPNG